jgi:hypothetical protein
MKRDTLEEYMTASMTGWVSMTACLWDETVSGGKRQDAGEHDRLMEMHDRLLGIPTEQFVKETRQVVGIHDRLLGILSVAVS